MNEGIRRDRRAGVLLPVASLPWSPGIGDFGPGAEAFLRWAARAGFRIWQILPLGPTDAARDHSPYSAASAFAGNPLLISMEGLVREGLLAEEEITPPAFPAERVCYEAVRRWKEPLLETARRRMAERSDLQEALAAFRSREHFWIEDYALFMALRDEQGGGPWTAWPRPLRDRQADAFLEARRRLADAMARHVALQFLAHRQWTQLKAYANSLGIAVMGDVPIYVDHDSADVWAHRDLFLLDREGERPVVAGVPPDYFSTTGQRWGNPLFNWARMRERGFFWWVERMKRTRELCDMVRLDHFRGFAAYWEVPAEEETAVNGVWREAPGHDLFATLRWAVPDLDIAAEDLGYITPDVHHLRDSFGFPGMTVLPFAFGRALPTLGHTPYNHAVNAVVYTGTHDANTARGWYTDEAPPAVRRLLRAYLGHDPDPERVGEDLMRMALHSPARTAILPIQDCLSLGAPARINTPGTPEGNWRWRLRGALLTPGLQGAIRREIWIGGRWGGA